MIEAIDILEIHHDHETRSIQKRLLQLEEMISKIGLPPLMVYIQNIQRTSLRAL